MDTSAATDFFAAVKRNDMQAVERLLAVSPELIRAADPESEGMTGLHHAAHFGHVELTARLIGGGADLNAIESFRQATPLHWAVFDAQLGPAELLLKAGARTDLKDSGGDTPRDLAVKGKAGKWVCFSSAKPEAYGPMIELLESNS